MRKWILFLTCISLFLLHACGDTKPAENTPIESTKDTTLTPEERAKKRRAQQPGAYDRKNAFSYIVSEPEMSMWVGMLKRSKWSEEIKTGNWMILGVKNELLISLGEEKLKKLRNPQNIDLLNEFVSRYIIKENITLIKQSQVQKVTTISGQSLELQPGAKNLGTAIYSDQQIATSSGSVVVLSQLMLQDRR